MVTGNVEIPLDLGRVQIHGQHAIHTGLHQQVRGQLGGDGFASRRFAIGARVAVIRHHGSDLARGGPATGIHHDQQLHQVIIHRSAGGLDQEDVAAANRFLNLHIQLPIGEALADPGAIGHTQVGRDLPRQSRIGGSTEQAQTATVLVHRFVFGAGCSQKAGHGACWTSSVVIRW